MPAANKQMYQAGSSRTQYPRKQPHHTGNMHNPPPEKVRRVEQWPQQQQHHQQQAPARHQQQQHQQAKNGEQKLVSPDGMPLNLEILDQNGQVTLPNGQKVVLVSVLEDGSFMQIKGSKYGEKVIYKLYNI